jgi:hypothetical protein
MRTSSPTVIVSRQIAQLSSCMPMPVVVVVVG